MGVKLDAIFNQLYFLLNYKIADDLHKKYMNNVICLKMTCQKMWADFKNLNSTFKSVNSGGDFNGRNKNWTSVYPDDSHFILRPRAWSFYKSL